MQAQRGVHGVIRDSETLLPISNATLNVVGRNMTFRTSSEGDFWRILLPGSYKLKVMLCKTDQYPHITLAHTETFVMIHIVTSS